MTLPMEPNSVLHCPYKWCLPEDKVDGQIHWVTFFYTRMRKDSGSYCIQSKISQVLQLLYTLKKGTLDFIGNMCCFSPYRYLGVDLIKIHIFSHGLFFINNYLKQHPGPSATCFDWKAAANKDSSCPITAQWHHTGWLAVSFPLPFDSSTSTYKAEQQKPLRLSKEQTCPRSTPKTRRRRLRITAPHSCLQKWSRSWLSNLMKPKSKPTVHTASSEWGLPSWRLTTVCLQVRNMTNLSVLIVEWWV